MRIMPVSHALMYKYPPRPSLNAFRKEQRILLDGLPATKTRWSTPVTEGIRRA